jgi:hypothetical protein
LENFPSRLLDRQRLGQLARKDGRPTADLKDESSEGHRLSLTACHSRMPEIAINVAQPDRASKATSRICLITVSLRSPAWDFTTAAVGEELEQTPRIFEGLLGIEDGANFDAKILDALTPEVILRLDALLDDLLQFGRREEAVRALRPALIYGVR